MTPVPSQADPGTFIGAERGLRPSWPEDVQNRMSDPQLSADVHDPPARLPLQVKGPLL